MVDYSILPPVNAVLNGLATVLLVTGWILIKQHRIAAHRMCMISAFAVSTLFLLLYLAHKAWKSLAGAGLHTHFHGVGPAKTMYLIILFSHLTLALAVPFLAIRLIRLGLKGRIQEHRRLARIALPLWLYVSVTGVLIYVMLYPLNPNVCTGSSAGTVP